MTWASEPKRTLKCHQIFSFRFCVRSGNRQGRCAWVESGSVRSHPRKENTIREANGVFFSGETV